MDINTHPHSESRLDKKKLWAITKENLVAILIAFGFVGILSQYIGWPKTTNCWLAPGMFTYFMVGDIVAESGKVNKIWWMVGWLAVGVAAFIVIK